MIKEGSISDKKELLSSIKQINDRILSFQNYAMRRVWGILFGILSVLILVDSLSSTLVSYYISSSLWGSIIDGATLIAVFMLAMFYWFKLFDDSLRISKFREQVSPEQKVIVHRNERFYWRNAILSIFLFGVVSEVVMSRINFPFRSPISALVSMLVSVFLDLIMLRGLKITFVHIPREGIAVFFSFLAVAVFSTLFFILGIYLILAAYYVQVVLLGIAVVTPLVCAFSFIYHAPDFLEETNGQ